MNKTAFVVLTACSAVGAFAIALTSGHSTWIAAGLGLTCISFAGMFIERIKEFGLEAFDMKARVQTWSPADLGHDINLESDQQAAERTNQPNAKRLAIVSVSDRLPIITLGTHRYLDLFYKVSEFDGRNDLFEQFNHLLLHEQYTIEGVPKELARRIADGIVEWVAAGHSALEEYAPGMVAGDKKRIAIGRLYHAAYDYLLDHRVLIIHDWLMPTCELIAEEAISWVNRRHMER